MVRSVLVILLAGLSFIQCFSQDTLRAKRNPYVKSFDEYFFLGPVIKKRELVFSVTNVIKDNKNKITFRPNNSYSIGLNMNVFDIGLEASASIPVDIKSINRFGESSVKDFNASAVSKRYLADAYWQKYSGFYYDYPALAIKGDKPFPQRPDIVTRNFGVSFAYVFNHRRFSMRSAYTFLDQQLKSKGSPLIGYIVSSFDIRGDSSLIPLRLQTTNIRAGIDQVRFTSLGLAPGYSYNLVYRNFFINATLLLGPAHYWVRYHLASGETYNDIEINVYSSARIGLGYNGHRFFSGLSFSTHGRTVTFEKVEFTNSINTFRFVLGYRFREFGILKKRAIDYVPAILKGA